MLFFEFLSSSQSYPCRFLQLATGTTSPRTALSPSFPQETSEALSKETYKKQRSGRNCCRQRKTQHKHIHAPGNQLIFRLIWKLRKPSRRKLIKKQRSGRNCCRRRKTQNKLIHAAGYKHQREVFSLQCDLCSI